MKIGIIGLPNVGKSSLFSLVTKSSVTIANYPFATIEPNIGTATINDPRLEQLAKFFPTAKKIGAVVRFWDIAGLVAGASRGEGLGNRFLSHIREADVLAHVVRAFPNKEIVHVSEKIDPMHDFLTIFTELALDDLATIERRLTRLKKYNRSTDTKMRDLENREIKFWEPIIETLDKGDFWFNRKFSKEETNWINQLNLLTNKKMIVVINIDPSQDQQWMNEPHLRLFWNYLKSKEITFVPIPIQFELEIASMPLNEGKLFQKEFGLNKSGFNELLQKTHQLLNLTTFFTAGPKEVRAWSFSRGANARNCAGIIHTDFAAGFIRAETIHIEKLLSFPNETAAKNAGKMRSEGQNYSVQDGDVCHFLFSPKKSAKN